MILNGSVSNKYINQYREAEPYVTKDGCIIRELMHPDKYPVKNQSIAEAIVLSGDRTYVHNLSRVKKCIISFMDVEK